MLVICKTTIQHIKMLDESNVLENYFWRSSEELTPNQIYAIYYNSQEVGLIQMYVGRYRNHQRYLHIDMIELFDQYRGMGLGIQVIRELFNMKEKINSITGEALPSAIPFWYGCGADFMMGYNKLCQYMDGGFSAYFKLSRRRFKG